MLAIILISIGDTFRPFIVKQLINTVSSNSHDNIWVICTIYAILQFMMVFAWGFSDFCVTRYTPSFRYDIAVKFMEKLYSYPFSFFQNHLSGNLTSKVNDAFQLIPTLIFIVIHQFGYFVLITCISLGLLFQVHATLAIVMLVWISLFLTITFYSMRKANDLSKEYAEKKSSILGLIADYISNIFSVKAFTAYRYEISIFKDTKDEFLKTAHKYGFYIMNFYLIQGSITSIYAVIYIIMLVYGYKHEWVSPGDFTLVVMLNFNIISNLFQLSHTIRDFVTNLGTVDQALSILDITPEIQDKPNAKKIQVTNGSIVFDHVTFHYKGTEPIFNNKSVVIEPGQKVGLVGYSGSGKTTFVNLILRLYDVTNGKILIDNQDIREVTQDSLRANISMIPQDPALFHRSIIDNIRYGRIEATEEQVIEAAKKAHAHEFINNLSDGYNSLVGERGVKLSGGQRQRIAIARAILKDAPILLLDEATSSLDSITEQSIQSSLAELMQSKTTIVIAHRLSTLLHMDRILVFEQGKIIQDGTHAEQLAQEGLYKTLWNAQINGFLPATRATID
jgi:ATP-binding cassette subfamily B protein